MSSMPSSDAPSPPACPVCETPASSADERSHGGIRTGNYLCPCGHIWTTRWLVG